MSIEEDPSGQIIEQPIPVGEFSDLIETVDNEIVRTLVVEELEAYILQTGNSFKIVRKKATAEQLLLVLRIPNEDADRLLALIKARGKEAASLRKKRSLRPFTLKEGMQHAVAKVVRIYAK